METQALVDRLDRGVMLALQVNQVLLDQLAPKAHWDKMGCLDQLVLLASQASQVLRVPLATQDKLDLQDHQVELERLALKDQEEMQVRQDHPVQVVK